MGQAMKKLGLRTDPSRELKSKYLNGSLAQLSAFSADSASFIQAPHQSEIVKIVLDTNGGGGIVLKNGDLQLLSM